MAVIAAQAHVLGKAQGAQDREEAAEELNRALSRSSHLLEQMLQLAKVDQERAGSLKQADLVLLGRQVLDDLCGAATRRHIAVTLDAPPAVPCLADLEALRSVIQNRSIHLAHTDAPGNSHVSGRRPPQLGGVTSGRHG